ncbi:MAG: hypothetical protein ACFWTM_07925 [Mitsuokella multacida]|jgi:hypothetical protein
MRCLAYKIRTLKGNVKEVYSIWRQADNPNYGKVFYASIAEYGLICGHLTNDDKTTC